jgi:RNA polymerase sigma-70 factor (ECF subfamily)
MEEGRRLRGRPIAGSDPPEDPELLDQIAHRREEGLLALHRRYVNLVYSLSLQILGEQMAAEEVTQDVFLRVWEQPGAYRADKGRFSSWLLTVTRHAAIDHLRHEKHRPALAPSVAEEEQNPDRHQASPPAEVDPELARELWTVLTALPRLQREILQLAYYGGMSQQEIATYLRLPLGTVKTRMRLGMEKLRSAWLKS